MTTYQVQATRFTNAAPANRFRMKVTRLSIETVTEYAAKDGYKGQIARDELARRA